MDGFVSFRGLKCALGCMLVFALLNVISVCPVIAHQVPAAQSCCEHSHGQGLPCTDTTPHNCPYVLLERSLTKAGFATLGLAAASSTQIEDLRAEAWLSSPNLCGRLTDSSGSYLLIRSLLI